jgi:YfiH family protein
VNDDDAAVRENRRRLQDSFALPGEPHWLQQTHGADIATIRTNPGVTPTAEIAVQAHPGVTPTADMAAQAHPGVAPSVAIAASTELIGAPERTCADGAWTDHPDIVLAVLTADCLPVVISDEQGTQLAVVHAGWRGLAAGLLENALVKFDRQATLHAWLGPAIGPQAFEVGEEVLHAYTSRNRAHAKDFKPGNATGKYWADLYALARRELQQVRSVCVTGGDYCTLTQSHWFHSHRRDGVCSGRMATVAWLGGPVR